jgi:hypothetical protein
VAYKEAYQEIINRLDRDLVRDPVNGRVRSMSEGASVTYEMMDQEAIQLHIKSRFRIRDRSRV